MFSKTQSSKGTGAVAAVITISPGLYTGVSVLQAVARVSNKRAAAAVMYRMVVAYLFYERPSWVRKVSINDCGTSNPGQPLAANSLCPATLAAGYAVSNPETRRYVENI